MKKIFYQAFTRLWGNGRFSDWDDASIDYIKSMGVDYIWFTGVPRHASGKPFVKGNPGCPYSVSDWTDVNPYFADNPSKRMDEFAELVSRVHERGLKVLLDYIPNHVAKDYKGEIVCFDYYDGDWSDTLKVDWSSPKTFSAMVEVLRFWASLGVDGFRCDMVELVPAEILGHLLKEVRKAYPELVFVAEVYGKDNYRRYLSVAGFDLLYDKSGLYDSLISICKYSDSARKITWNWQFLGDMQSRMLNFLENHDEMRLSSSLLLGEASRSYAALAVSALFNDASFMLYFGQEVGEDAAESTNGRTSIFDWSCPAAIGHLHCFVKLGVGLNENEKQILSRYREILKYAKIPAFASGKCWDLCYCNIYSDGFNADRHFAFLRYDETETYLVVCNFSNLKARITINFPDELSGVRGCKESVFVDVSAWDVSFKKLS